MLTAGELAQARADVLETLVSDVTLQRATTTVSDSGYPAESWATAATVKGRIDNLARSQTGADVIAMQEKGRALYQLTVEWNADLRDGDRVLVDGVIYELKQANIAQDVRIVRRGVVVRVG